MTIVFKHYVYRFCLWIIWVYKRLYNTVRNTKAGMRHKNNRKKWVFLGCLLWVKLILTYFPFDPLSKIALSPSTKPKVRHPIASRDSHTVGKQSKRAVFSSNSLPAIVSGEPYQTLTKLIDKINTKAQWPRFVLHWSPAHIGSIGNKTADQMAKKTSKRVSITSVLKDAKTKRK